MTEMNILDQFKEDYQSAETEYMSMAAFLDRCKTDSGACATPQERLVKAIGEPEMIDTSVDPRLSRIFSNRTIRRYPAFEGFYGMEDTIERIVAFLTHGAQGLEERKQILYLLGPVGGGKSSLAERLKEIMQREPIYVLCYNDPKADEPEMSPVFESPLALFASPRYHDRMASYNIPVRYLKRLIPSPWAVKRLKQAGGDISLFSVAKLYPSQLQQIAVVKTEPGDENNQDISCLVGKTDIRMLERFAQNDPDSYSFSGALCRGNQGLVEFVEMFKAPIKVLHPLLTATQEGNYMGTEAISAIPFDGIIVAHSNEAEWQTFRNNPNNEAFLDRIYVVKVPYCPRATEEKQIYEKMVANSQLATAPCAPGTLDMLAQFSVLTRLKEHANSTQWSKMQVYDGKNVKETDPRAKSVQEYRDAAGIDEGMSGISTRFAFKVLSATFNHDPSEVAADPVHLMYALEKAIIREQFPEETEKKYLDIIKSELAPRYAEFTADEIQKAYLEAYDEFGQTLFDRYIVYADHWMDDLDYKDPDTGVMYDREYLNNELEKIEKTAGIANPKDFRHEVVKFVLRQRANGKVVKWTSYEKLRKVIEKKMFANTDEMLPIVSFGKKASREDEQKHDDFVARMMAKGYTEKQVRRIVDWHLRIRKAN
jgi:serine protein kinase